MQEVGDQAGNLAAAILQYLTLGCDVVRQGDSCPLGPDVVAGHAAPPVALAMAARADAYSSPFRMSSSMQLDSPFRVLISSRRRSRASSSVPMTPCSSASVGMPLQALTE